MKTTSGQWTILYGVTFINVLVSAGYAIVGVVAPQSILPKSAVPNDASTVFALYAAARAIPLMILVIYSVLTKSKRAIIALGALAGFIQFFDGFVGIYQHNIVKIAGPFFLSLLQLAALFWVWKKDEFVIK